MEKSDGVSDLYMRDYEADVPLITYLRVIKGQDTSVTSVTPTLRQRHTDTDRGRQREANTGEEDGKDVNMLLGRSLKDEYTDTQWKTKYILKIR